ncbi:MAG: DUF4391 domain-containing protein [Eubacterium sp.]|uniref:DUF4391 domain-containing protein n=1 Tax=Eubacterium sp. TaxID=142586 RepID=UPI00300F2FBD
MFDLPKASDIRKPLHKKLIYEKYASELSGNKRDRFDADISRIVITNEISEASVRIKATEKIPAIFVVQVEMKRKEYDDKNIIMISKLFGQKLLIVLHYESLYQLAIYETRLLKSEWEKEDDFSLKLNGLDMNQVWDNFVTQVSGIEVSDGNTLAEQINIEAEKEKIKKQIADLECKARKEVQAKKKFEMVQQINQYKERLRNI